MDKDLDIANYSIPELTTFFRFQDLKQCSPADIELREVELRELILSSPVMAKGDTSRVIVFLADAKRELLHALNIAVPSPIPIQAHLQTFTTIPYVIQEDVGAPLPDAHTNISAVCIDSLFRDNSNTNQLTGDFVFTLAKPITNVVSIKPVSAEVPISWHTVSATRNNNEMTVFVFNATYYTPTDNQYTITIPNGTYSREKFVIAINTAFAAAENGVKYLLMEIDPITNTTIVRTKTAADYDSSITSDNMTLPYDSTNAHYAPDFYFVLDFTLANGLSQPLCKNLGWMAGFREKWYTVKFDLETNIASVSSEARFDPRPGAYVFIEIDDFTSGAPADVVMSRALNGAYIGRNVLARISIASSVATGKQIAAGSSGDRVFYRRVFSGPVSISKLKVRLLDRFGDTIDLRGSDLSFVLEIETAIGRSRIV